MEDSCKAKGAHRQPEALAVKYPARFLQPKSQGQRTHLSTRSLLKREFFPHAALPRCCRAQSAACTATQTTSAELQEQSGCWGLVSRARRSAALRASSRQALSQAQRLSYPTGDVTGNKRGNKQTAAQIKVSLRSDSEFVPSRGFFSWNKKKLVKKFKNVHKSKSEATEIQCQPGNSLLPWRTTQNRGMLPSPSTTRFRDTLYLTHPFPRQEGLRSRILPSTSPGSPILGMQTAIPSFCILCGPWCSLCRAQR